MIDHDLASSVGSHGRIDKGDSLSVKGTFQRLQQEEINNMSSNRSVS